MSRGPSGGNGIEVFRSSFPTNPPLESRLRDEGILAEGETVRDMVDRVVEALTAADGRFAGLQGSATFAERLGWQLDTGRIVLSPSIMAHAGRFPDRPLVACAAPPLAASADLAHLRTTLQRHQRAGMGIGLVLDEVDDPPTLLRYLNHLALVDGERTGRPGSTGASGRVASPPWVEHVALLSVSHPAAEAFAAAKVGADTEDESWQFTVTLLATEEEMRAARAGQGRERAVLETAAAAACDGADPGVVFADRLHATNPVPHLGSYTATSPAGEVGLLTGETCTFGQVNLARFHRPDAAPNPIDFGGLADSVYTLVRALDDAVAASASHHPSLLSTEVTATTRKIGVGVCGLADLLEAAGLAYGSPGAHRLAQEVLTYVTYVAKLASVDLAVTRGACDAVGNGRSRYASTRFLRRLAEPEVRSVTGNDWAALAERIVVSGMLRNASLTAVGPTGVGAVVAGASDSIAPGGGPGGSPGETRVDPAAQVTMVAAAQACVDEAVATTVRLPPSATSADVYDLFVGAWELGCHTVRVTAAR